MQITNGQIEYEHPHKVADFQIPKAKVTLSFVLDPAEDVDLALTRVGEMARGRAISMASGALPAAQIPPADAQPPAAAVQPTPRGRRTAPVVAPEPSPTPAAVVSDTSNVAPAGDIPSPAADPRLTDKGLQQAIQQKLDRSTDRRITTNAIRALVGEFTGDAVKQIYVITDPAARAEFLARLGGLS